jgi:hypothetical protein
MRTTGIGFAAAGVLLNNYAYLHGINPDRTIVIGSMRYKLAAAGVILTAAGLFLLLRWARKQSGLHGGPTGHSV